MPKTVQKQGEDNSQLFSQGRRDSSSSTAAESPLIQKVLLGLVEK